MKDTNVTIVTAIATTVSFPTMGECMQFPPSSTDAGEEIGLMFLHRLML
jgi:hypothetical protein